MERWKSDQSAVMVGTRSLMTGVDAEGRTCSLVVVDRPPRSGGNPVDDARVRVLAECARMDRWAADRLVYVADAALLLGQAAGRLIRAVEDRGMVAILDPRLVARGKLAYPKQVRDMYLSAVSRFEARTSDASPWVSWPGHGTWVPRRHEDG